MADLVWIYWGDCPSVAEPPNAPPTEIRCKCDTRQRLDSVTKCLHLWWEYNYGKA